MHMWLVYVTISIVISVIGVITNNTETLIYYILESFFIRKCYVMVTYYVTPIVSPL
jgi:hypothetical protein